ncbi:hypothetical protein FDP41_003218 [Naegleria fowleri]|uniref:Radical SAM core domain-containing protein n=1 Tax=Naegleria fowleri TaxID=5763 RepID=A0A6A5BRW2_NAEFO|nr:uncharacterized protein FDP41_003218 [Naegleria fowleri]KAF0977896.1 hypothetical protein FDP41_003218 [Naegleria fowleri]CAG4708026.1 unnamed protein product [Naegleria fowleri]
MRKVLLRTIRKNRDWLLFTREIKTIDRSFQHLWQREEEESLVLKSSKFFYHHPYRNQIITAQNDTDLHNIRTLKSQLFEIEKTTQVNLYEFINSSEERKLVLSSSTSSLLFRNGLTFTPFAFATICNANCQFCSENLQRKHLENSKSKKNSSPSKRIRNYDQYFNGLERVFQLLDTIQKTVGSLNMGLSLSGLEATSEPIWLERLCQLLSQYPSLFDERVLYSNGSGFTLHENVVENYFHNSVPKFDRIELSRQHFDEATNQAIMRFEKSQPIRSNTNYEHIVRNVLPNIFGVVKNSCILSKQGISNVELIEQYLQWAISLNVHRVVFRELSIISHEEYFDNSTKKWIDENRVSISSILSEICSSLDHPSPKFEYLYSTVGYYYMNECYRYDDKIDVIFETSSYEDLLSSFKQHPRIINKLIFHPNGNLTSDWNDHSQMIGRFFNQP